MRTKKTVEKVMIPTPPIWKRIKESIWPAKERSCPISITFSPVTQTAEVAVKKASMKERDSLFAAHGWRKRTVPARIVVANPKIRILSGDKWREKKGRIEIICSLPMDLSNIPERTWNFTESTAIPNSNERNP